MSQSEKFVIDNEDREFFEAHYRAIAERLQKKRLWRGPWRVEIDGCVFKFKVEGYAKRGSEAWNELQAQYRNAANDAMNPD